MICTVGSSFAYAQKDRLKDSIYYKSLINTTVLTGRIPIDIVLSDFRGTIAIERLYLSKILKETEVIDSLGQDYSDVFFDVIFNEGKIFSDVKRKSNNELDKLINKFIVDSLVLNKIEDYCQKKNSDLLELFFIAEPNSQNKVGTFRIEILKDNYFKDIEYYLIENALSYLLAQQKIFTYSDGYSGNFMYVNSEEIR